MSSKLRHISLNQIFTLSLTLFTLCVIGAVTWFFYHQQRSILLRELQRHGLSLAENLAYNSEYGLLFVDVDNLKKLVDGVMQDKDVLFASIVNIDGAVVAQRALQRFPSMQQRIQERVAEILRLLKTEADNTYTPTIYFTEHSGGVYHIFAPVFVPTVEAESEDAADPSIGMQPITAEKRELLGLTVVGISFERVTALLKEIQRQILGLALFIVILTVVVARFLVNTISRPIGKLAAGTHRIARGDLTQEVEVNNPSEIADLAQSFNQMMHDLRLSQQELERWAQTLE
ncbi:HAMP domain-containing protein, partial [candidate division KSB3 bacterium]|nr:HAMP domain-containing protein [candidate division KSB3 bacterium]MBD3327556.1 HAMP domain-containing protein [candidate division KSB3 bacterium]